MKRIPAEEARAALGGGGEVAFLDVREHGQHGEGHPLLAVTMPYSRLEIEAARLLPCKAAPIILLDDGDGVAERAARRLEGGGHADVAVLDGGAPGWAAAGFTLFKGENVPSKAFGELLEHARHTPGVGARELKAWLDRGEPLVLVDGRTPQEHARMTLPGSTACPNAELGHRLAALAPDPATPIVVHCAGRTRSILGAEGLRALGVPNPVYAMRNGTMGWRLAGLDLEHGSDLRYPALDAAGLEASRARARAFMARNDIPAVGLDQLAAWRADPARTLYVLDVRTDEEYRAGHLPRARHAPGGQLVQATDRWVAVRGARVVLCDDTGLRAALAAHWLRCMGHEAVVLDADTTACGALEEGPEHPSVIDECAPRIGPEGLARAVAEGAALVDLRPSMAFRAGHVAGARWSIRPRLQGLGLEPGRVVLLAADPRLADLAAVDLRETGLKDVAISSCAFNGLRAAGLEIVASPDDPPDADCIDHLFFVHDRHAGNLLAAQAYLDWETGLVDQLDASERALFRMPA